SAVELLKVGINPSGAPRRRRIESAHWNHHETSTGKIDFQFPRDSDVVAQAGQVVLGHSSIEVRGAINNQGLTVPLKYLLLQNRDGCGLTTTVVSRSGVTAEDANSRM